MIYTETQVRTEIMDAYMTEKRLLELVPPSVPRPERMSGLMSGFRNWAVPITKSVRLFFNGENGHLYLQIDRKRK